MRGCTASIMSASAWVGTQQLRAALCHQVCAPGRAAHFWPGCPSPESGVEERSQAEELEAGADEQVHGQEVEAWGEGGGGEVPGEGPGSVRVVVGQCRCVVVRLQGCQNCSVH